MKRRPNPFKSRNHKPSYLYASNITFVLVLFPIFNSLGSNLTNFHPCHKGKLSPCHKGKLGHLKGCQTHAMKASYNHALRQANNPCHKGKLSYPEGYHNIHAIKASWAIPKDTITSMP